jgi:hypothetical protein
MQLLSFLLEQRIHETELVTVTVEVTLTLVFSLRNLNFPSYDVKSLLFFFFFFLVQVMISAVEISRGPPRDFVSLRLDRR